MPCRMLQCTASAVKVTVIGHQFWWEYRYPQLGVFTANELHIPVSNPAHPTPTFLQLLSADTDHSFWIPELAGKTDLIPNHPNRMWMDPQRTGIFVGQCAQYCGTHHAKMLLRVSVDTPERFEEWVREQRRPAIADERVAVGKQVFETTACINCHSISGTVANGRFGRDLTHLTKPHHDCRWHGTKYARESPPLDPRPRGDQTRFTDASDAVNQIRHGRIGRLSRDASLGSPRVAMSSNAITNPALQVEEKPWVDTLHEWVTTVDHKPLGILYILSALLFLAIGGVEALIIRTQFMHSHNNFVSPEVFNRMFTMHGTTMIFFVAMPILFGFANYLVPLMIGARDMAFPRLNAFSLWLSFLGGLLLYFSFLGGSGLYGAGNAPDVGWWAYAPLGARAFSPGHSSDYWTLALLVSGFGSIGTAINTIATALCMRCPGMKLSRMPLLVWRNLVMAKNRTSGKRTDIGKSALNVRRKTLTASPTSRSYCCQPPPSAL
jgi:hypothetical protein